MLGCAFGGGTASKIWIKQEKLLVRPLDCAQVFTQVEGGDRRPQSAVWRVGVSWQIVTEPLLLNLNSILVYVFYDYFLHSCTGRRT